jgi:hypothetical protein
MVITLKTKTKIDFVPIMKVLIAFSAGALIGDSFIHLIPKGFGVGHEEEHVEGE